MDLLELQREKLNYVNYHMKPMIEGIFITLDVCVYAQFTYRVWNTQSWDAIL